MTQAHRGTSTIERHTNRNLQAFRWILWIGAVSLVIWLLNKNFIPGGKLSIRYEIPKGSPMVSDFASKEKYQLIGRENTKGAEEYFQLITTDPLYFTVTIPKPFPEARVSIRYQNPDNQPLIRLGVKQAGESYAFREIAMYDPILENLPDEWEKIRDGDLVLWQKNNEYLKLKKLKESEKEDEIRKIDSDQQRLQKELLFRQKRQELSSEEYEEELQNLEIRYKQKISEITQRFTITERPPVPYSSVKSFLSNPADPRITLQLNSALPPHATLPGYQPNPSETTIEKSIRGEHELVTFLGENEDLNFTFLLQDINRHVGKDPFTVEVWRLEQKLFEESIGPLGSDEPQGQPSPEVTFSLHRSGLLQGVYNLRIKTHDDVLIKRIETKQDLLMFKRKVYLAENDEYRSILGGKKLHETKLYTTSREIKVSTAHEKGHQNLTVGKKTVRLEKTHLQYVVDRLSGVSTIVSPLNDIRVTGEGYFAFSEDHLFSAKIVQYENLTPEKDLGKYDFILARYLEPQQDGDWLRANASIKSPELYVNKNKINFLIQFPGLPENSGVIRIQEIRIDFLKQPVTFRNIVPKARALIQRTFRK